MAFIINVFMLNELYSQEFADIHHAGEETADNKKYDWEDELNLQGDIVTVEVLKNANYILCGTKGDGAQFEIEIPKMLLFNCTKVDQSIRQIAVSESLVSSYELKMEEKIVTLYLKGLPYANPIPGIYIASKEFPKELIPSVRD